MVFFRFPFHSGIKYVAFDSDIIKSNAIHENIAFYLGTDDFSLHYNGRELARDGSVPRDANILVTFSLPGGKGGFGSMLRAIGAQIEKTTNREACRDLSGRRLRDINEEQRLKKWISKESEREAEKARRRKDRIERLKSKPRHNFNDFEYEKKLSEGPDRVEEALAAGMEKRSKRPAQEASCSAVRPKKKHLWLDEDISCSSDSDPEAGNSDSREATTSDSCTATNPDEAGSSSFPDAEGKEHTATEDPGDSSEVIALVDNPPSPHGGEQSPTQSSEGEESGPSKVLPPSENAASLSNPVEMSKDSLSDPQPSVVKVPNEVNTTPIDLMSFEAPSELEALGLDRLKWALTQRGLKCGGSIQDRTQRLWKVRDLQPHQYPQNLLAKKK